MRALLWTALLLVPALSGCTSGDDEPTSDQVVIETDMGDIVIQLDADAAPKTVANFLKYVDDKFYDNTLFHRIIKDFMIQGGGMGTDGEFKDPTYPSVVNEAKTSGLKNTKYTIAMARTNDPNSATTQFFINHADNAFLDASGNNAGYAVFGAVIEGKDVVDKIAGVPVEAYEGRPDQKCQADGQPSCPVDDVVVKSIRRGEGEVAASAVGDAPDLESSARTVCPNIEDAYTPEDIILEGELQAGLITPGVWNVCSTDERMLLWAHNSRDTTVMVSLTAALNGGEFPEGWDFSFEEDMMTLSPLGSKEGREYTDWGYTVMHLTIPEDASGSHELSIVIGTTTVYADLVIADTLAPTITRGDRATVTFDGDFTSSGEGFWEGSIPNINVGSGGLVTGVDLGLLGLGYQETASLIVPPALAYGYDNPEGSGYEQFNGEWLTFKVTADDF